MAYTGTFATIGIALDSLQYQIHSTEKAKGLQRRGTREQEAAQQKAESAMLADRLKAREAEENAVKQTDVDPFQLYALETDFQKQAQTSPSIPRSSLRTSGTTMLGDA